MAIKLSILDQSPISEGSNAMETLQQTAQLARKAEEWGYTRFWVSEHHDTTRLAGSSPEILISHWLQSRQQSVLGLAVSCCHIIRRIKSPRTSNY